MTTDELQRLATLREYEILDTQPEIAFDRITALTADLFDTPIVAVSLIDSDRQWFKSSIGLDVSETPRDQAFCDHTIRSNEVMVVPDTEKDDRFRANPLVLGDPLIRFYAGAPLTLRNGVNLGALCIIDRKPRPPLTDVEKRRLAVLAQIVVNEMDFRLTTERLQLARLEAEAASRAKSEFLANMSHEVRTPLTAIIGFAGILGASKTLADQERRFVERIGSASQNLLTIVNDVLDLAKLESGELDLHVEPVDAVTVVAEAMDLIATQAEAKGLILALRNPENLPPVAADAPRLRQVMLNLLSNAVKFTDAGSVTATVTKLDGETLEIAVADTGIGIPPDRLTQIFERFVQADSSISRTFGGTGLGLAISQRLVESMGGGISVTSAPGEGSVFRVELLTA
jgi:signal transduction histidine kinase